MTTPPMTSTLSSQPSLPISDITPPASRGLSTLACFPVTLFMLPIYLTPFTGSQRVPKEVVDRSSPAWNKGRIYYSSASDEVIEAYSAQFAEDMAQFLQARAEEIADGGLMIIIFPARPDGIPHSQVSTSIFFDMLEACLIDMAKKGMVSQEKVDLFNLPMYYMSPKEVEEATERNGCFSIEKMEILPHPARTGQSLTAQQKAQVISFHIRAIMEGLIKAHFGDEIRLDQLFDSYSKKLEDEISAILSAKTQQCCAVLKRKTVN